MFKSAYLVPGIRWNKYIKPPDLPYSNWRNLRIETRTISQTIYLGSFHNLMSSKSNKDASCYSSIPCLIVSTLGVPGPTYVITNIVFFVVCLEASPGDVLKVKQRNVKA